MRLVFRFLLFLSFALLLVQRAEAQYFKSKDGTIMVRIVVHYKGPERSPYLARDAEGIRLKEANAAAVSQAMEAVGGKVTYQFKHVPLISGAIPVKRLAELTGNPLVVEIAKDHLWYKHGGDIFTDEEARKAFVKKKVEEIKARLREKRITAGEKARNFDPSLLTRVPMAAKESKEKDKTSQLLEKPVQIRPVAVNSIRSAEVRSYLSERGVEPNNYSFYNISNTQAAALWGDTRGEGVIVAVIDSGTYDRHPLMEGNVIGGELAPGLEDLELAESGVTFGANAIQNDAHGTGTACMIACHGRLTFPAGNRFLQSVEFHAPGSVIDNGDGTKDILLFGSAPGASIYAIKVFPWFGGGTAESIVLAGMDRAITLKDTGRLNIAVVNMSLGGPGLFPGFAAEDILADHMVDVGIQPVISAGNAGPAPYTISEPGSALKAITVGASSEAHHYRILLEQAFPELTIGEGSKLRLSDRTFMAQFSSHGPLATGFGKPDVVAEGAATFTAWLFDTDGDGVNDLADTAIVGGTSFSAPTTAGAVALLTAYGRLKGLNPANQAIKVALLSTAKFLNRVGNEEQGKGFIQVKAAADFWTANPVLNAYELNNRQERFKGKRFFALDYGYFKVFYGITKALMPGEQDDFLIPIETSCQDQGFITYLYVTGPKNPQRIIPFPPSVRDDFDPDPADGVPPYAALYNNTEVFYHEGINTGFSDGDYIIASLNQVDTLYAAPPVFSGLLFWYPDFFPGLTTTVGFGYVADPSFGFPLTNVGSTYGFFNNHQQMGSGGFVDYDRLSFLGDNTNDDASPVKNFWIVFVVNRSIFGLTTGTPTITDKIAHNQVKQYTINLSAPSFFYSFHMSFKDGWNNMRWGSRCVPLLGSCGTPLKKKRKAADIDFLLELPDGTLLNEAAFPGLLQGLSLNDVEVVHDLFGAYGGGPLTLTAIGFDVQDLPANSTNFEVKIWDGFVPIVPCP